MSEKLLYTEVADSEFSVPLSHKRGVILLGSCFSQNIGQRLERAGFETLVNPFGITFNPISISDSIQRILDKRVVTSAELQSREDINFHYEFHSSFSGLDENSVVDKMNASIAGAEESLRNSSHLIITLGTAWVYRLKENNEVVNNCHKIPQEKFDKSLLGIDEIVSSLTGSIKRIRESNPDICILLTLSPVRHWKDGATENSVSKATLRRAIHELIVTQGYDYFPAYEILLDELRDYRFYADDLIHPSWKAQEIIWKRFVESSCTDETLQIIKRVEKYRAMMAHRPLNPDSVESKRFLDKLAAEKRDLEESYPFIHLDGTK